MGQETHSNGSSAQPDSRQLVAVIELGTTSVRMAVAEMDESGRIENRDALQQAVTLGKDTFTNGAIGQATTEACVAALRSFRRLLKEYGITDDRRIRAVATSAVREAANRDAFLDRIFIATGIDVRAVDEAEVCRYTYSAVYPLLASQASLRQANTLVVEVGGGSTEVLVLRHGEIMGSHTYRLGSLRLRAMLEDYGAAPARFRELMQDHVDHDAAQIKAEVAGLRSLKMLALGGDIRFAATLQHPEWDRKTTAQLDVAALARSTEAILGLSVDQLARRYHLSYPDAETVGPALLAYLRIAQALKLKQIVIGAATLRDGILSEMAIHGQWADQFRNQVISSAIEVGKKYHFNQQHGEQVARVCQTIFHVLRDEHRLGPKYELILTVAALLHEIGGYISNRMHHKHAMYLILHSDIFGLGAGDLALTALVARYHRRATPRPTHEVYGGLNRDDRIAVAKMGAILRVADALVRRPTSRGPRMDLVITPQRTLLITLKRAGDPALEQHALREKGQMFEQVYGMTIELRTAAGSKAG